MKPAKGMKKLEAAFARHGFDDFKWIDPAEIVVAHWVRMKCMYGCGSYGRLACCPPNVPSVAECRKFLDEYRAAAVFHFQKKVKKPEDRRPWGIKINASLLKLEREVFLAGHQKAFLLPMDTCHLCRDCAVERNECKQPKLARPAAEALAVDVFSTVKKWGYPIEVLDDYSRTMNRYAFLLID